MTFEELQRRIEGTVEELKAVRGLISRSEEGEGKGEGGNAEAEGAIEDRGRDGKEVEIHFAGKNLKSEAGVFVTRYAVPNFFFHVSIAYGILRSCGVSLGKADYLGIGA